MKNLFELSRKHEKYVVGLMSGTSVDAVDTALVKIDGNGLNTRLEMVGFMEYPIPSEIRKMILKNSVKETGNVEEITILNFILPQIYVNAIKKLCNEIKFPINKIDLIGSHGQTIQHLPNAGKLFGFNAASTLQIGDPDVIAKLLGIITVGDFRIGDMALGGQGAPLVPYFDYILFHSNKKNRALLNVGGISNITVLDKNGTQNDILAFDCGPGNMLIDFLMKKFFGEEFDKEGQIAKSGNFDEDLFNALVIKDNFIETFPPKSTGREYYGKNFLNPHLDEFRNLKHKDWIRTITEFTAYAVFRNYEKFIRAETKIEELFVSGGGVKNDFLLLSLKKYFGKPVEVKVIDKLGISPDAKEAICFAVLANETISSNPTNIPKTTGATRQTILGKICLP